jgi:hypothetical protein
VRYSRTGLAKRALTEKGEDDHFGVLTVDCHDFGFPNYCQRTGLFAPTHYRDSNPACHSWTHARNAPVIASGYPLTKLWTAETGSEQKQRNVPVWAIHGQYSFQPPYINVIGLPFRVRQQPKWRRPVPAVGVGLGGTFILRTLGRGTSLRSCG